MSALEMRPYQRACVDAVHEAAARGVRRPLVAMATGCGKSLAAAHLVRERPGRAVILAHRDELLRQLGRSLEHAGIERSLIGFVKAEEDSVNHDYVVASIQTLARPARLARLMESQAPGSLLWAGDKARPFTTVIADEAHHHVGGESENTFGAVLRGLGAYRADGPLTVGWTATPERGDGAALSSVWQEIVFEMGIMEGIAQGYLCDIKAKQIQLAADFNKLKTRGGDFRDEEAAEMLMAAAAPAHVVKAYKEYAPGRKALVFVPTVAVAEAMSQAFRADGIKAETAHGGLSDEDRAGVLRRLRTGETMVVPNAQLLTEGFDEPSVDCIDAETEILTPLGWRGMWDPFREVVALDQATWSLSVQPVIARVMKPSDDVFVAIKDGHSDIRVTGRHRMLVGRGRRTSEMSWAPASELPTMERFRLPLSAQGVPATGAPITDDELRFVAWFMTDGGWHRRYNQIVISQAKPLMVEHIRQLIARLGYACYEETRANRGYASGRCLPITRFIVPIGVRGETRGWARIFEYLSKDFAAPLLAMDGRQFEIFWSELLLGDGDGNTRSNRTQLLCVAHEPMLSGLQALAALRGFATNTSSRLTQNGKRVYLMWIGRKKYREVRPARSVHSSQPTGETVWCVQNPLETLVIRRRGRVSIVGNCIVMARPTKSRPFAIQMIGRGTRIFPGKEDCMVLDVVGSVSRMDLVTVASLFDVDSGAAEGGILKAVAAKRAKLDAGVIAADMEPAQPGRLVSVDVSLFAGRAFQWVAAGAKFVLSLGEKGNLILRPGGESDEWEIVQRWREVAAGRKWPQDVERKLYAGLSLEEAQGRAEDLVRQMGASKLNAKDANWRKDTPTDKQIAILKRRGRYRDGMSKGEASDALTALFQR